MSGARRRYELTLGAISAMASGRYFCIPPICQRNSLLSLPLVLEKMFRPEPASTTLWCTCMALPGSPSMGAAMKVA